MLITIYYADGTCDVKKFNFTLPTTSPLSISNILTIKVLSLAPKVLIAPRCQLWNLVPSDQVFFPQMFQSGPLIRY